MLEDATYIVQLIDGDYAHLKRTDKTMDDLKLVARALLPHEIDEGLAICFSDFQYKMG